jgi:hypothetical protein
MGLRVRFMRLSAIGSGLVLGVLWRRKVDGRYRIGIG